MIPASFSYVRVSSALEAAVCLADHTEGSAALLAGGNTLLPMMKLRVIRPRVLVDIGCVKELSYIIFDGDWVKIGSLTRLHEIENSPLVRSRLPLLAEAAANVGDIQVRNRATLGGALATGDAASDLCAVVLALEGVLVAQDQVRARQVSAGSFFEDERGTLLEPAEIIREICFRPHDDEVWSFERFQLQSRSQPIVGVAIQNSANRVAVALSCMGTTPLRAKRCESAFQDGASAAESAHLIVHDVSPADDFNASASYRLHLARSMLQRLLPTHRTGSAKT